MKFAEDFVTSCAEQECSIQVHHVLLLTSRAKMVRVLLHKRVDGTYFYDSPDNRGGTIREELAH
jgi:hypothetical protein